MPQWLIKLFHSLGRKQTAKRTGIAQIPTQISAEAKGAEYFNILVNAGLKPEDMAKHIKSEKDIIRLVNKVESIQKQTIPKVKDQSKVVKGDFNPNEEWWKPRPGKAEKNVEEVFFDHPDDPRLYKPKKEGIAGIEQQMDKIKGISDDLAKMQKEYLEGYGKVIPKEPSLTKDKFFRIKQGLSTKIKLNTLGENKQLAKELINKKNVEFNSLDRPAQKEVLERLDINIKNAKADFATPVDPDDFASGGIARVGMAGGGALWKFIQGLFIKASNEIRLGKGLFKGLNEKQRIVQHDNLTKMVEQWQKTKTLPEGAEQYFGVDAKKAFAAAEAKVKKPKVKDEYYSKKDMEKEWAHENKLAKQEMKQEDQMIDKALSGMDERTLIKTKYPGITDDLLNKILIDDNPQRKADVMATMDQYMKLREVGKGEQEAFDILTKDMKKPTKHAAGGVAGQLHLNRPGYESGLKVYPKIDITKTGSTPAEGIDVDVRDITVGGTGLYQGDKWFAGAEGLTGNVKVDVTAGGETLFKDTMSKDDALNYIFGLGEAEGDKFQIKSDKNFDNVQIVFKKKFNQGGLAHVLGV